MMLSDSLWPHWRSQWVLYEDEDLLVVDKPAGIDVQQQQRSGEPLADDAQARLSRWLQQRGLSEPYLGVLGGLDREISGVFFYSRSRSVNAELARQLEQGVRRSYVAALTSLGRLADQAPPSRGPGSGKSPDLQHRVLKQHGPRMLVELLSAARSQPIRRWLAAAKAPAAGDEQNGGAPAPRLMLHVAELQLSHPRSGRDLRLTAPLPRSFDAWLRPAAATARSEDLSSQLRTAVERRYSLARAADTDAFRLVNGAGDGLAGMAVDVYGDHLVLSIGRDGELLDEERLLDALSELRPRGIYLKRRPRQASDAALGSEQLAPAYAVRGDSAPSPLEVREHGLRFEVRLGEGLATGIYLDQRDNRALVRSLSAGRQMLNLFGYQGAFTVAAAAGGAARTVTVDSSQRALQRAAANLALNQLSGAAHAFVTADVPEWLRRCSRRRERFDLIVLDPPSYSTTKQGRFRAHSDYQKLAAVTLRCLAPGGTLLACTNHQGITEARLRSQLLAAARSIGCPVRRLRTLPAPSDHPPPPGSSGQLKSVLLES